MKKERSSLSWCRKASARKKRILGLGILAIIALFVFTALPAMESIGYGDIVTSMGISLAALPVFMVDSKFVELSKKDFTTFTKDATAEELAEYYNQKNQAKSDALQEAIDKKVSKVEIKALKAELMQDRILQMKSLNETLKQHGLLIKKLTEAEKAEPKAENSILEGLKKHKEALLKIKEGSKDPIKVKVAATMLSSTNISGGNVPVEQRLPGLDVIATRRIRLMDLVARGVASSNLISWVSQAAKDGAAGGTTEGALKNKIDFDLVVDTEALKQRTAFVKVSNQMVDDIDFLSSEINNELMRELMLDIENQVYQGDDTGNNLNGIRTVASAFAAGTFANTVDNANFVDVLRVAMDQIDVANQEPATAILAHPSDVTTLLLIKTSTTDRRYIDALQVVAGQLLLDGVPIVKTTLVTKGEYLVGNFPSATVWDRGEINIEVGLDGDDFTKNLRTIRGEWRGLVIVKTNKRSAFVSGVIATDAAALETP